MKKGLKYFQPFFKIISPNICTIKFNLYIYKTIKHIENMENLKNQFGLYCKNDGLYLLRNCIIRKETDKALLIVGSTHPQSEYKGSTVSVWIPKSIIIESDGVLILHSWFRNKKVFTILD
jgi:hypothetical protein